MTGGMLRATMLGLLFVAIELHIDTLSNDPSPDRQQGIGYCVVGLFGIVLRNSCELPRLAKTALRFSPINRAWL